MRILIAHTFYRTPGGEDSFVRGQVDLLQRDHVVELFSASNTELRGSAHAAGRIMYSRAKRREFNEVIRRFQPELIHVHNVYPSMGPVVHLAAAEAGIPLVMTVHNYRLRCPNGYRFTEGAVCDRCTSGFYGHAVMHTCFPSRAQAIGYAGALWVHRFLLSLERKVAMFLAPSDYVRGWLIDSGIPEAKARTVRNFVQNKPHASASVGSYGLYLGRLSSEKGIDILLQALARAGDPPFRIVGDGLFESELRALAKSLSLRNTRFVGRIPHDRVDEVVAGARFVVMPTRSHETLGIAGLEAMALGRPLIVSNRGGLPEIVRGENGMLCPADDVEKLASAVGRLNDEAELCRRYGEAGIRLQRSAFSPEVHRQELERVYEACLDN